MTHFELNYDGERFYYKKHIKGSIDNFEVAECWCYETGKISPFLVTTEGYAENVIKLLNERNGKIQSLKNENENLKLNIQTVLQEEYDERSREMNYWASEEDWNGYGATQLERGTVLRIARKLAIKLDER